MAFVNSGKQRTLNLTVKKTGNDNSVVDPYLTLNGKLAFGSYAEITQDEMQKLSDEDFADRVAAWKTYLWSTYASDVNLQADIEASFKYVNGLVVRLIGTEVDKQYKTTIYPFLAQESITSSFDDPYDNTIYSMTIPIGGTNSNVVNLAPESTSTGADIDQDGYFYLDSNEFGNYLHYTAVVDGAAGSPIYPLPV